MAEEKLQYMLTLATRATGTGARDTAAAMFHLDYASIFIHRGFTR